jgi:hypothetical protein
MQLAINVPATSAGKRTLLRVSLWGGSEGAFRRCQAVDFLGAEPTMILGCAICIVAGLYIGIIIGRDLP